MFLICFCCDMAFEYIFFLSFSIFYFSLSIKSGQSTRVDLNIIHLISYEIKTKHVLFFLCELILMEFFTLKERRVLFNDLMWKIWFDRIDVLYFLFVIKESSPRQKRNPSSSSSNGSKNREYPFQPRVKYGCRRTCSIVRRRRGFDRRQPRSTLRSCLSGCLGILISPRKRCK